MTGPDALVDSYATTQLCVSSLGCLKCVECTSLFTWLFNDATGCSNILGTFWVVCATFTGSPCVLSLQETTCVGLTGNIINCLGHLGIPQHIIRRDGIILIGRSMRSSLSNAKEDKSLQHAFKILNRRLAKGKWQIKIRERAHTCPCTHKTKQQLAYLTM